jgi:hypothetical protein
MQNAANRCQGIEELRWDGLANHSFQTPWINFDTWDILLPVTLNFVPGAVLEVEKTPVQLLRERKGY